MSLDDRGNAHWTTLGCHNFRCWGNNVHFRNPIFSSIFMAMLCCRIIRWCLNDHCIQLPRLFVSLVMNATGNILTIMIYIHSSAVRQAADQMQIDFELKGLCSDPVIVSDSARSMMARRCPFEWLVVHYVQYQTMNSCQNEFWKIPTADHSSAVNAAFSVSSFLDGCNITMLHWHFASVKKLIWIRVGNWPILQHYTRRSCRPIINGLIGHIHTVRSPVFSALPCSSMNVASLLGVATGYHAANVILRFWMEVPGQHFSLFRSTQTLYWCTMGNSTAGRLRLLANWRQPWKGMVAGFGDPAGHLDWPWRRIFRCSGNTRASLRLRNSQTANQYSPARARTFASLVRHL